MSHRNYGAVVSSTNLVHATLRKKRQEVVPIISRIKWDGCKDA